MVDGRHETAIGMETLCGGGGMVSQAHRINSIETDDPTFNLCQKCLRPVDTVYSSTDIWVCSDCFIASESLEAPADNPPPKE